MGRSGNRHLPANGYVKRSSYTGVGMNPLTLWNKWWGSHGTKIVGFGTSIAGTLALLDHETMNVIGNMFGPVWEPRVVRALMALAGLIVARRGFMNTRTANASNPPQSP